MFFGPEIPTKQISPKMFHNELLLGRGEVGVDRGTGVSRGVRPTTWERSLKK